MIFEYLEKRDLHLLVVKCKPFYKLALYHLRMFYAVEWIHSAWRDDAFSSEVNMVELQKALLFIEQVPLSKAQTNRQFQHKITIPTIPVDYSGKPSKESIQASYSLLHLAASFGLDDMVRLLLKSGAEKDSEILYYSRYGMGERLSWSYTPLFLAEANQQWRVATQLIQAGAKIGQSIFWPILHNSAAATRELLEAQPTAWDVVNPDTGQTALWQAIEVPHTADDTGDVVKILRQYNADERRCPAYRRRLFKLAFGDGRFHNAFDLVDWAGSKGDTFLSWYEPANAVGAHLESLIRQKVQEKFGPTQAVEDF
ncbi:ankyrin repeat domain protein [Colletotrichum truncatum]|uniref:Ankyrin repeat domain protein n=1 Tax=Colletotrichum truncatum TaxID=5467 RepID=A0ACC3YC36_COLTU|nr:ankyrin repeat domain protein [Colletotrichum truncatum]KAF6793927.1 ankyrin repeat domain protein [Colletotrichum truncatum]